MRTLSFLRFAVTGTVLSLALLAAGCGSTTSSSGGGTTTDATTTDDTGAGSDTMTGMDMTTGNDTASADVTTGTDTTTGAISFATIYPKIKTDCATSGCHTAKDAKFSGKLDLEMQDTAYAALVTGATADGVCGPMARVKPKDHAASSLWVRLDPAATGCGNADNKMPLGGTAWSAAEIAAVAAWIDAGAAK